MVAFVMCMSGILPVAALVAHTLLEPQERHKGVIVLKRFD